MNTTGIDSDRFDTLRDLLSHLTDGTLSPSERDQLCRLIQTDPAVRQFYFDYMLLDAALGIEHAVSKAQTIEPEVREVIPLPQHHRSVWLRLTAVAALIAIAVTAWFLLGPAHQPDELESPVSSSSVAVLTSTENTVFVEGNVAMPVGSALAAGPVNLLAGRAQIMFNSTAVVDLIGPCTFEMTGPNRGTLISGQLEAQVSERAVGFTVDLPGGAQVVDLGTHFRLGVDKENRCTLEVIEGRVVAIDRAGNRSRVIPGAALVMEPNARWAAPNAGAIFAMDDFNGASVGWTRGWDSHDYQWSDGHAVNTQPNSYADRLLASPIRKGPTYLAARFRIDSNDPTFADWIQLLGAEGVTAESDQGVSFGISDHRFSCFIGGRGLQKTVFGKADSGVWYWIVARFEPGREGRKDRITVWVDPTGVEQAEFTGSFEGTFSFDAVGRVRLRTWQMQSGTSSIDDLRIGPTWSSVYPSIEKISAVGLSGDAVLNKTSTDPAGK